MANDSSKKIRPDTINKHIGNVYPALAMLAGMELDVFTPLANGKLPVATIAKMLGLQADKLEPLLYALVTAGLLQIDREDFSNTSESQEFLVKGSKRYLGGAHSAYSDLWSSTMHTAASIRAGAPQAKHDFSTMSKDELRAFIRGLDAGAGATARRLHKTFDMQRFKKLLDAGGGSGGVAIELCKLCPDMNASVGELANVAVITRECIAESSVAERVSVIDVDLVNNEPAGHFDAAVLRALLQVLSTEQATKVVQNVVASLDSGGELFIVGRMLDDSRLSPLEAVAVNVMFLNVYDHGKAYTESEYRAWLTNAGMTSIERTELAGGYSIMHALKP
jgi:hypothetical protein